MIQLWAWGAIKNALPYLVAAGAVAGVLAGAAGWGYSKGKASVQKRWDADKTALAQAVASDLQEQQRIRSAAQTKLQEAINLDNIEKKRITIAQVAVRTELDGLRTDVAIRARAAARIGCASERNHANTAEQLFGECAAQYTAVAQDADGFANEARFRGEIIQSLQTR